MPQRTTHFNQSPHTVTVMVATNGPAGELMLQHKFNPLTWASDNMETVAHYYEGSVIELVVTLDPKFKQEYIRGMDELSEFGLALETYAYGFATMRCPANATWYVFSKDYLASHLVSISEIFPDLSEWNEC